MNYAMEHVPERIKSKEFCEHAVKCYSGNLKLVPEELKTEEMCRLALEKVADSKGDVSILESIPENLRTREICERAVSINWKSLKDVPDQFKDWRMCKSVVKKNPEAIQYVPLALRQTLIDETIQKMIDYIRLDEEGRIDRTSIREQLRK